MKASNIAKFLKSVIPTTQVGIHIQGPPGVGKTAIVNQVFQEMGTPLFTFYGVTKEPVDATGVPFVRDAETHWAKPSFIQAFPQEGIFGILIDELNQCDPSMQKTLSRVLGKERAFGDYKLPDGARVISTGNRASDKAGAHALFSHTRSRLCVIDYEPNIDDWCRWALANGTDPKICAFINFLPKFFLDFDPKSDSQISCPRSLCMVSELLPITPPECMTDMVHGTIGPVAGTQLIAFLALHQDLPDIDAILAAPHKAPIFEDTGLAWAVCGAIQARIRETKDKKLIGAAMAYAHRMPREFAIYQAKTMASVNPLTLDPSIPEVRAFIQDKNIQPIILESA